MDRTLRSRELANSLLARAYENQLDVTISPFLRHVERNVAADGLGEARCRRTTERLEHREVVRGACDTSLEIDHEECLVPIRVTDHLGDA